MAHSATRGAGSSARALTVWALGLATRGARLGKLTGGGNRDRR